MSRILALALAFAALAPTAAFAGDPRIASYPDPVLAVQLSSLAREGAGGKSVPGVAVYDLDAKAWLFEHEADRAFNPASVTKVVTTSTALKQLGSGFTFKTHLYTTGRIVDGVLQGDLVVKGEGDPSLTVERLWRIASLVRVAGVHEIAGNLLVDDTYFDTVRTGIGYEDFDEERAYTAPLGATSATWNTVNVVVRPGSRLGAAADVVLDPPTGFVKLVSRAITGTPGSRRRIKATIENRVVTVSGSIPLGGEEKDYYRPIDDPPAYFGTLLSEYLAEDGILIHGKIATAPAPAGATLLFDYESEPLGVIVRDLNKYSNNFTAEQILKALGAEKYGAPGSTEKGLAAEQEFLGSIGIDPKSSVIQNGSGLTRDTKLSPRLFVKALTADYDDFQVRGDFVASLGIAGEDGTMRHRMLGTSAQGALRAKTGTVDDSSCIAGYARAPNGHTLAFAFLVNGTAGRTRRAIALQDRLGAVLTSWNGGATAAKPTPPPTLLANPESPH